MSTKAAIGLVNSDDTITGIYCGHDGYVEGLGKILLTNYNDCNLIQELIAGGNIKHIRDSIQSTEYYIRDYSEPNNKSQTLSRLEDFERYYHKMAYYYLYSDNMWMARQGEDRILGYFNLAHSLELIQARNGLK